jgi:vacuolar-type H+-ATPase subunit I/STV1
MQQCYTDIPREQLELMEHSTGYFVDIIKDQGTVFYMQFIEKGIRPGATTINRDDLTHVRHWAEIINQEATLARFKLEKMAPDIKKANAIIEAEEKRIKRLEDSEAKKLKTKESKAASKRYVASLTTVEEIASYNAAQKKQKLNVQEEKNANALQQEKKRRENLEWSRSIIRTASI